MMPSTSAGRRRTAGLVQPLPQLDGVEADQVPPLDERDALLGDEAANMAHGDTEVLSDSGDVQQVGQGRSGGASVSVIGDHQVFLVCSSVGAGGGVVGAASH